MGGSFTTGMLIELVRNRLASAQTERVVAADAWPRLPGCKKPAGSRGAQLITARSQPPKGADVRSTSNCDRIDAAPRTDALCHKRP
jgi:hypothetical protein